MVEIFKPELFTVGGTDWLLDIAVETAERNIRGVSDALE